MILSQPINTIIPETFQPDRLSFCPFVRWNLENRFAYGRGTLDVLRSIWPVYDIFLRKSLEILAYERELQKMGMWTLSRSLFVFGADFRKETAEW